MSKIVLQYMRITYDVSVVDKLSRISEIKENL